MDKLEPTLANLEIAPAINPQGEMLDLHPDLNRLLMRKLPFDIVGQAVLLLVAAALIYRHAAGYAYWPWLGLAACIQGARYLLLARWERDSARPDPGLTWLTLFSLGTGVAWGALAFTPLYAATNVPTQTMVMWTVAAAIIWFASTQSARALPFAAFAVGVLGPWLMKIPGVAPSGMRGWIQPESNNLIALALFVAFAGLGAVVYTFQRQTETRRLRAEAEVASLAQEQVASRPDHDQQENGHATPVNSLPPALAAQPHASATSEHTVPRIEPQVQTDQAARVITSIDNMLALSKIDAGSMRPAKQRVSLRGMLDQLLLPSLKQAQEKRLKLRCVLHAGVPLEIVADQEKLLHILGNLVGNAIKYTLRGEVVVSVRREDAGATRRLSFEVADTGPGIRNEDQKRVFEPYFQSGAPSQDAFNGLGLGLTVAQRLAHLLGGDVTLESHVGKGTVCIVLLPVEIPSEATPRVTATEELALGSAALAGRSATVTRLPAANDAFSARGDGFQRRQEPVYATRPER